MLKYNKLGLLKLFSAVINRFYISIRLKLALVSLTLLVIPFIGYQYIQEMEQYLRQDQESALLENARVVSAVLEDYPKIFSTFIAQDDNDTALNKHHLFIRSLRSPILIDGYAEDWVYYRAREQVYKEPKSDSPDPISFRFSIGTYQRYLYAMFQVKDKHVIYRKANSNKVDANDHLQIALQNKKGQIERYILADYTQGSMSAHKIIKQKHNVVLKSETRIGAYWQETRSGYNIELRIPLSMVGKKLAFGIADVDDRHKREVNTILATTKQNNLEEISTISVASPAVEKLLARLQRRFTRIWVVDKQANVLALSGQLVESDELSETEEEYQEISFSEAVLGIIRLFYRVILKQPAKEFQDDLSAISTLSGTEIGAALQGVQSTQWRLTPDAQVNILTATAPVIVNNEIVGGVAIEETSNSILILQNRAIEILINLSIVAFVLATIILLGFATRLSIRIRHLRNQTENAIGEDGRIHGKVTTSHIADEIGDLTRSFGDMLNRLTQYNRYLETMASKLSHEFRTPITVVKSSLDNLESANLDPQSLAYSKRAREGIERLNNILTRMSEATRLEQTLQSEHYEVFDLEQVVSGCVNGYKLAKVNQVYEFTVNKPNKSPLLINGVPDLIAQQLDKLVSNANSFSLPDTPIAIGLSTNEKEIILSVENQGPLLPDEMHHTLFESMVSVRDKKGDEPHLGLGLYIARLIAEFHNAKINACNNNAKNGVRISISFPSSIEPLQQTKGN